MCASLATVLHGLDIASLSQREISASIWSKLSLSSRLCGNSKTLRNIWKRVEEVGSKRYTNSGRYVFIAKHRPHVLVRAVFFCILWFGLVFGGLVQAAGAGCARDIFGECDWTHITMFICPLELSKVWPTAGFAFTSMLSCLQPTSFDTAIVTAATVIVGGALLHPGTASTGSFHDVIPRLIVCIIDAATLLPMFAMVVVMASELAHLAWVLAAAVDMPAN